MSAQNILVVAALLCVSAVIVLVDMAGFAVVTMQAGVSP